MCSNSRQNDDLCLDVETFLRIYSTQSSLPFFFFSFFTSNEASLFQPQFSKNKIAKYWNALNKFKKLWLANFSMSPQMIP